MLARRLGANAPFVAWLQGLLAEARLSALLVRTLPSRHRRGGVGPPLEEDNVAWNPSILHSGKNMWDLDGSIARLSGSVGIGSADQRGR